MPVNLGQMAFIPRNLQAEPPPNRAFSQKKRLSCSMATVREYILEHSRDICGISRENAGISRLYLYTKVDV